MADAAIDTMSFEEALRELEGLVTRLESGAATLDESIALYERGAALKSHCDKRLKDAQLRVEQIVETAGGVTARPAGFDAQN
ncbi:MAG: exodeoxyribonuclease VII small subunit [Hyphomonadaceae bacterium]|jgi:exodeoxyribonuclease VII small subunit|nr:exodeoxyribonuclease VII small subunit [Hyphomonadaceae bacterium]